MKLHFLTLLLLMVFASFTTNATIPLAEIGKGSVLVIHKDFEVPANRSKYILNSDYKALRFKEGTFEARYEWEMVLKKSKEKRFFKKGDKLNITKTVSNTKSCYDTSGVDWSTVKFYIDHPEINYIEFRSGAYISSLDSCISFKPNAFDISKEFLDEHLTGYAFTRKK